MRNTLTFTNQYVKSGNTSNKKGLSVIEFLFFGILIFYYLLPSFNVVFPVMLIMIVCVAYTAVLCILHTKGMNFFLWLIISAIIISLMYYILTETSTVAVGVSNYTLKRLLSKFQQVFMSFFPLLIFYRMARKATRQQKISLLTLMIILFLYVVLNTMIELQVNENATRSWGEFEEQNKKNVSTYAYVYAVPIIISCLPYWSSKIGMKKTYYKALILGIEIFLFAFLLLAQYTLALLISVIILFMQISSNIKNHTNKIVLWGGVLLAIIALPSILNFLAERVPSQQMAIRLREMATFFNTGDASGDNLGGRLELYGETIKAFLKSPFFGNRKLSFDGHATFLTVFADIGIFGGMCFVMVYILAKKLVGTLFDKSQIQAFKPAFIGLILMGLTNPIHSADPLAITVWLFVPLIIVTLGGGNEKNLGN